MADSGLTRFINRGIRFATTKPSTTYVGLKTAADPVTSFDFVLPAALPGATSALTVSPTGTMLYQPVSSGTITSVNVSAPADFTVDGGPVMTSGTISLVRNSQSANLFLASPDGAAGVPVYRAMVAADVPSLLPAKITGFDTQVRLSRLDQMAAPTAVVSFNGQLASGLATPVNSQDAATKLYVDSVASSISNKSTARVATTGNINLTTPGATIDGITMSSGDVFLAASQSVGSENGLWVWNGASSAATRATNADASAEVKSGMFVFVQSGTVNGSNGFTLVTPDPIVLGTTALSFIQTSGAGQILAGSGLTKNGNSLDVVGTADRILVAADSIDISANYAGQSSITTVGTITSGTWNGTATAIANGGTGATTAASARAALGATAVYRQSFTNASLTTGVLTVTHSLGQQHCLVEVYDDGNRKVPTVDDVTCSSTTSLTVDLTSFGTLAGTWQVVVIG